MAELFPYCGASLFSTRSPVSIAWTHFATDFMPKLKGDQQAELVKFCKEMGSQEPADAQEVSLADVESDIKKNGAMPVPQAAARHLQRTVGMSVHAAALEQDPTAMALAASICAGKKEVNISAVMGRAKLEELSAHVHSAKEAMALLQYKEEVQKRLLTKWHLSVDLATGCGWHKDLCGQKCIEAGRECPQQPSLASLNKSLKCGFEQAR